MIRGYECGDIFKVNIDPEDDFGIDEDVLTSSFAYTIVACGEVIGVVGASVVWGGVAHGWVMIDPKAKAYPTMMVRSTREIIDRCFSELKLVRLHTLMRPERKDYLRWAELVGFKYESAWEKGGMDGKDILMYSIVR